MRRSSSLRCGAARRCGCASRNASKSFCASLIRSDGKIVVSGFSSNGVDLDFAIARYDVDGSLDATFGRRGVLGGPLAALGIELPFTSAAVVLAGLFVAAPFYVRAARSGFLGVPRELEEAARVEGASEWQVFRFVTMPVAAPALFGGAILCWARALGEFGATIMFAGQFLGRTQTMPLAIYAALESDLDAALALSVVLLAISFGLLVLFRRWLRQVSYGVS